MNTLFESDNSQKKLRKLDRSISSIFREEGIDITNPKSIYKKIIIKINESGLSKDEIVTLRKKARENVKKFIEECSSNYGEIASFILEEYDEKSEDENKPNLEIIEISEENWIRLKRGGIEKINDGDPFGYFGGVARVIAREVLGIDENLFDSISDFDLFLDGNSLLTKAALCKKFSTGPEGIRITNGLTEESIQKELSNIDLSTNELCVANGKLYISSSAIESLRSGVAKIRKQRNSLYGKKYHIKNGETIFLSATLYRAFSLLVRGKISGFKIPTHNIDTRNIKMLNLENHLIIIHSKILNEEKYKLREKMLLNFGILLEKLGLIGKGTNFSSYEDFISTMTKSRGFKPSMESDKTGREKMKGDAIWKLTKVVRKVLGEFFDDEKKYENYDIGDKKEIVFSI